MNMTYQRNVSFYHGKGRCALSFIFNLYFDSFYQIYFLTAIYICDNQFNSIQFNQSIIIQSFFCTAIGMSLSSLPECHEFGAAPVRTTFATFTHEFTRSLKAASEWAWLFLTDSHEECRELQAGGS